MWIERHRLRYVCWSGRFPLFSSLNLPTHYYHNIASCKPSTVYSQYCVFNAWYYGCVIGCAIPLCNTWRPREPLITYKQCGEKLKVEHISMWFYLKRVFFSSLFLSSRIYSLEIKTQYIYFHRVSPFLDCIGYRRCFLFYFSHTFFSLHRYIHCTSITLFFFISFSISFGFFCQEHLPFVNLLLFQPRVCVCMWDNVSSKWIFFFKPISKG